MKAKNQANSARPNKKRLIRSPLAVILAIAIFIVLALVLITLRETYLDRQDRENMQTIDNTITQLQNRLQAVDENIKWNTDKYCVQPEEKYRKLQLSCVIATESLVGVSTATEVKNHINTYQETLNLSEDLVSVDEDGGASPYPILKERSGVLLVPSLQMEREGSHSFRLVSSDASGCYSFFALAEGEARFRNIVLHASIKCSFDAREAYFPITERP